MSEWRDIATAPKDGSEFLAAYRFEGERGFDRALLRYDTKQTDPRFPWVEENGGRICPRITGYWMPVPPLPTWLPVSPLPTFHEGGRG